MEKETLSQYYIFLILIPVFCGTIARYITLIIDYRQYPSYPNGYLINLVTGFIASGIGAVAIPAFLEKNFEAVTFLFLATEQFREVRRIAVVLIPIIYDEGAFIETIKKTPLLESIKKSYRTMKSNFNK